MNKRTNRFRPMQDFVSEEMVSALLEASTYDFNGLFQVVHTRLRARQAIGSGQEMLRLRMYEKLSVLVSQGLVKKDGKEYSGVRSALEQRAAEMTDAKARQQKRRAEALHAHH